MAALLAAAPTGARVGSSHCIRSSTWEPLDEVTSSELSVVIDHEHSDSFCCLQFTVGNKTESKKFVDHHEVSNTSQGNNP